MAKEIKKIAIANRGEIAVRIISACLEMGKTPILLYSEADKNSLAYRLSPEKVCIGSAESQKSYLNVSAVIKGALKAGAEALHPGYGFLSEKAELVRACDRHNIIFIGPSASALSIFGDKVQAREQAMKCGLPVLPATTLSLSKGSFPVFSHVVDLLNKDTSCVSSRRVLPAEAESAPRTASLQREDREAKLGSGEQSANSEAPFVPSRRVLPAEAESAPRTASLQREDREAKLGLGEQSANSEAPFVPSRRVPPADSAVMIKAIGGGGGRGLRIVRSEGKWGEALLGVQREAKLAFGSSGVFVEKYLSSARHIEVQVLVSAKGEAFYLFDRDCSIQRKHQKIIEEAPACLPISVRRQMEEASLVLLNSVGYRQAGTVEFLYQDGRFYFMEVNPRIQVECPVTEMILGVDLIKAQILVAEGREPFFQKCFEPRGHSLQCRIYAEDMIQQIPVFGQLGSCYFPHGVYRRFDMGYESGDQVPSFYDSMLGKLIVYGENRAEARQRMKQALCDTVIFGLKTNLSFLQNIISHPHFIRGDIHTRFVEEELLPQIKKRGVCVGKAGFTDEVSLGVHGLDPSIMATLQGAFADSLDVDSSELAKELRAEGEGFNPWTYFADDRV